MSDLFDLSYKRDRVKSIIAGVYNVPTFPMVMNEINRVIDDPMASAQQLAEIIKKDQGLVAKILSVANSPFYGSARKVSTVQFAILLLGFDEIKNIVLALSLLESFNKISAKTFNQKRFWLHSIMTATASKKIAEDLGVPNSGEAFTAGLLHDIGHAVICKHFAEDFNTIHKKTIEEHMPVLQAEQETLGVTHTEVAGMLLDRWNLPSILVEAVKGHHSPSGAGEHQQLASLVHLADYMTDLFKIGDYHLDINYILDSGIISILNLGDETYLKNFAASYQTVFEDQFFSLTN